MIFVAQVIFENLVYAKLANKMYPYNNQKTEEKIEKAVNKCIIARTLDKVEMWKQLHFDAIFIGDDWKGNPRWEQTKIELAEYGVEVIFLPHTDGISSTILSSETENSVEE